MVEFTVFKGSKEGKIIKSTTQKELKPDEVLIKVTHSGLCGTDEHYKHADMGLGHEGAGVIEVRLLPVLSFKTILTKPRKSGHLSRHSGKGIP
jgi:NADPH:quinone reductase-like Zn-dependent oxidoreductase